MSSQVPACLAHLGLDTDADERAVRKAYAGQVKQLDQHEQLEQFQALREAYEAALHWCRSPRAADDQADTAAIDGQPESSASDADAPDTKPATKPAPQPTPPKSYAQRHARLLVPKHVPVYTAVVVASWQEEARTRWSILHERIRRFAASPEGNILGNWRQMLASVLEQEAWQDLRARPWLEQQIADLLAAGWRPGHQYLYEAAVTLFHWNLDVTRLRALGEAGQLLGRALDQQQHFLQLADDQRRTMLYAIARLRNPDLPEQYEIKYMWSDLQLLMARYPQWMHVVSSVVNFERWRQSDMQPQPKADVQPSVEHPIERYRRLDSWLGFLIAVFLLLAVLPTILRQCASTNEPAIREQRPKMDRLSMRELETKGRQILWEASHPQQARPEGPSLSELRAQTLILPHIAYTPPAETSNRQVRYLLTLSAGRLQKVELIESSGLPAFDQAVRRAIGQVPSYPPELPPSIALAFNTDALKRAPAAAH
ncbi:TonB C-terminal domain-containing protein [uncultured Herbaspirillum sp.]|uniref:TonB C-terminal domain-containing protein n=1 Tax=uncultured Herbaspirillum sp. TaxID=160236 RepID=UPI00258F3D4E|nr:TonB C-terminal domain-containing protein [uncultured Herbaspirillum sp.]